MLAVDAVAATGSLHDSYPISIAPVSPARLAGSPDSGPVTQSTSVKISTMIWPTINLDMALVRPPIRE